ncbi:hypothetical protein ISR92_03450 [Patescibacteria group bacterium]|nr:hypothetical protein [Patescibacteria group bacterium]
MTDQIGALDQIQVSVNGLVAAGLRQDEVITSLLPVFLKRSKLDEKALEKQLKKAFDAAPKSQNTGKPIMKSFAS